MASLARLSQCARSPRWWLIDFLPRLLVSSVFVMAGLGKMWDRKHIEEFAKEIRAYGMVAPEASNPMAYILPWLEVTAAVLLVAGVLRREARLLIGGMLVVFLVAKGYVAYLGLKIDCGCVPKDSILYPLFNGPWGFVVNSVMLALLIWDWWICARARKQAANPEWRAARRGEVAAPARDRGNAIGLPTAREGPAVSGE